MPFLKFDMRHGYASIKGPIEGREVGVHVVEQDLMWPNEQIGVSHVVCGISSQ